MQQLEEAQLEREAKKAREKEKAAATKTPTSTTATKTTSKPPAGDKVVVPVEQPAANSSTEPRTSDDRVSSDEIKSVVVLIC